MRKFLTLLLLAGLAGCSSSQHPGGSASGPGGAPDADARARQQQAPISTSHHSVQGLLRGRHAGSVAALPDHGKLIEYRKDVPAPRTRAYTWHPVGISEEHAVRAIGGELVLPMPDGQRQRLRYDRHIEHPDGNWTWIGRAIGAAPGTEAIITFGEKAVFGSIPYGSKPPLRLTTGRGRVWMMETRATAVALLSAANPRGSDVLLPPGQKLRDATGMQDGAHRVSMAPKVQAVTALAPTVDLLLGYTSAFATRLGGQSQANTRLTYLVDVTNQAYANSQVDAQVRLVKTLQVSYPDATANNSALFALTGCTESGCTQVDPALQPLHDARDQYGADVVSLVRNFNDPENGGCGIAWLIGGGQSSILGSDDYAAMSVVSDSNGLGGPGSFPDNGYVCRDETLAHELGHNMGSAHDRAAAAGSDGVLEADEYGRYPYSFGYKTTTTDGNFFTVMAYGDSGQTRYRVFSNPQITFCGGRACGTTDQADNARSLRQTIPIIASFRSSISAGISHVDDMDGDGKSDVFWRHADLGALGNWLMDGASARQRLTSAIRLAAAYTVAGRGDFNGDGRVDVLWTSAARNVQIWFSTGDAYTGSVVGVHPQGWTLSGVGDFSGDGKDDILIRNIATGAVAYWRMSGAIVLQSVALPNTIGSSYSIVGIRDFDANGRPDVLWTSPARDLRMWYTTSSGEFGEVSIGAYDAGWSPLGVGDVDGDEKADILLRQDPGGAIRYLLMDGAVIKQTVNTGLAAPLTYRAVAIADYNGDHKADLLWTSDARDLWMWVGTGTTFNASYLTTYPNNWSPTP